MVAQGPVSLHELWDVCVDVACTGKNYMDLAEGCRHVALQPVSLTLLYML